MQARLTLSFLGSFDVRLAGLPVDGFESDKVRALLVYLAVESAHAHSREQLANLLWPDQPERRARQDLSQALYNLRLAIGDRSAIQPFLTVSPHAIRFNPAGDYWLDVKAFLTLIEDSLGHSHHLIEDCDDCLPRLQDAVGLYGGEFLSGFSLDNNLTFYEWTLVNRERLQRLMMNALNKLTRCYEARGALELALQYAWRQVGLNPLWEPGHRQLIRILAAQGRRSAALAHFEDLSQTLRVELNLTPDPATVALIEQIRNSFQQTTNIKTPVHNLPAPLTAFVGRQIELGTLTDRLKDPYCRILTLLGPGGSGKTRLSIEVARRVAPEFSHGVFLVQMASIRSPEDIPATVANVLRFPLSPDVNPEQQVLDYLQNKEILFIMDSFEHQLDGVSWALDLLRAAPGVKILATSRTKLNVKGEHLYPLDGLLYPGMERLAEAAEFSAIQLFKRGALRVNPHFQLTNNNLAGVLQICQTLRGMPLGILLASAFMDLYSPMEIAQEIDKSLDFLTTNWQDVPARQRSMRAVFDYSWKLLSDRECEVFQALSVFRDGFSGNSAEKIITASNLELQGLVDKSFLHRSPIGRYELHDLSRQFAAERLAENELVNQQVRDRHCSYFLQMLREKEAHLKDRRQPSALRELDEESGNLREAWDWAVSQDQFNLLEHALEGLCSFYDLSVRYEAGRSACQALLDGIEDHSSGLLLVRAECLTWNSHFERLLGDSDSAKSILQVSQTILEEIEQDGPDVLHQKAFVYLERGHLLLQEDRLAARESYQKSLLFAEELNDLWGQAQAFVSLGKIAHHQGAYADAQEFLETSLTNFRKIGEARGIASALALLGFTYIRQGDISTGEGLLKESISFREKIGDRAGVARGLDYLCKVYFWSGNLPESRNFGKQCLAIYEDLGSRYDIAFISAGLILVNLFLGRYEEARQDGQKALALTQDLGCQREHALALASLGGVEAVKGEYQRAESLSQKGVQIYRSIGQKDELGWALSLLSHTYRGMGKTHEAWNNLREALEIGVEIKAHFTLNFALVSLALLLMDEGHIERAVELYSLALNYPLLANSQWAEDVAGQFITRRSKDLPVDFVSKARERGRNLDLIATAKELLEENVS